MNNITIENIKEILEGAYNQQKNRSFKFITGPAGEHQFRVALYIEMMNQRLAEFTQEEQSSLKRLLNSSINEDFILAKEIIDAKYSR